MKTTSTSLEERKAETANRGEENECESDEPEGYVELPGDPGGDATENPPIANPDERIARRSRLLFRWCCLRFHVTHCAGACSRHPSGLTPRIP